MVWRRQNSVRRVAVFAEGVNITDERYQKVGRYPNQILLREQTGPRYTVGVRAAL
jgi:iron complex outermembrane recepter protein